MLRNALAWGFIVLSVLGAVACTRGVAAPAAPAVPVGAAVIPAPVPADCAAGPVRRAWAQEFNATGHVTWRRPLPTDPRQPGVSVAPVVIGGTAFFAEENAVYAQATSDGRRLWRRAFPATAAGVYAFVSSRVDDLWQWHGAVIAEVGQVTSGARLLSLNPATGAVRWMKPLPGGLYGTAALTGDGGLAMITGYRTLAVVDLADGHARWSRTAAHAPVVAVDGVVVVPSQAPDPGRHGAVTAYDARTGRPLWARHDMPAEPVLQVAGGRLVVYGGTAPVTALSPRTGLTLWRLQAGGPVYALSPGASVVAVATYAPSRLSLIDLGTGRVEWRVPTLMSPGTALLTRTDVTFIGAVPGARARAAQLVDLRASDGSVRWHARLADLPLGPVPVLSFGADVVVSIGWGIRAHPARLVAYRMATGAAAWTAGVPALIEAPLVVSDAGLLAQPTDGLACPDVAGLPGSGASPAGGPGTVTTKATIATRRGRAAAMP